MRAFENPETEHKQILMRIWQEEWRAVTIRRMLTCVNRKMHETIIIDWQRREAESARDPTESVDEAKLSESQSTFRDVNLLEKRGFGRRESDENKTERRKRAKEVWAQARTRGGGFALRSFVCSFVAFIAFVAFVAVHVHSPVLWFDLAVQINIETTSNAPMRLFTLSQITGRSPPPTLVKPTTLTSKASLSLPL